MSEKDLTEKIPEEVKKKLKIGEKFATLKDILIPAGETKIIKIDDLVFEIRKISFTEWEKVGEITKNFRNPFAIARGLIMAGGLSRPKIKPEEIDKLNPILALRLATEILKFSGLTEEARRRITGF